MSVEVAVQGVVRGFLQVSLLRGWLGHGIILGTFLPKLSFTKQSS